MKDVEKEIREMCQQVNRALSAASALKGVYDCLPIDTGKEGRALKAGVVNIMAKATKRADLFHRRAKAQAEKDVKRAAREEKWGAARLAKLDKFRARQATLQAKIDEIEGADTGEDTVEQEEIGSKPPVTPSDEKRGVEDRSEVTTS